MKILYIITQSSWGGAQKYVYNFSLNLNKKEDIEIVVTGGRESIGELNQKLDQNGVKFIPIKNLVRAINPIKDLVAVWELKKIIEIEKPDIIHLNSSKAGAVGSLAGKLAKNKPKIIYTVHGWVFNESLNPIIKIAYFLIEKLFANFKDVFICLSEFDRRIGLKNKIAPAKKIITIHNGLTLPDNYFLTKETALEKLEITKDNKILIGAIANFYPTKGLRYLIEATKIIATDYKLPIKIIIIGDGDLRHQLEQQIKDLELKNNVILAGSMLEAGQYLKAFDLAVVSSVKEGFPFFILEAMLAGLPIVTTKVGGIPEIITNGQNGFLVEPKNPQMLADKIKELITDKILMAKMSDQNLKDVKEKFSLQKMIDQTLTIYNE